MTSLLWRFFLEERGADAVEYALLISLIFLAIIGAVHQMAIKGTALWTNVSSHI
ncbi:MAG TPA: Flp family type IVb pilin [Deltaproteobacteria bacterium]|nr:Flp family type IVb pilin [Deltaproteobacteria bacterium]